MRWFMAAVMSVAGLALVGCRKDDSAFPSLGGDESSPCHVHEGGREDCD